MPLLAAALLLALPQSDPLPSIRIEPAANGWNFVIGSFAETQSDAVTEELKRRAAAKCGSQAVRWGRFTSMQNLVGGIQMIVDYNQKFSCIDPANDPYKPVPADWQPSAADERDAVAFANRALAAIDGNNVPALMSMFEPLLDASEAEVRAFVDDFRSRSAPAGRKFRTTLWGANPEMAAHPGAFAYIVFDAPRSCGYFMLYRAGPGTFQIARQHVYGIQGSGPLTPDERAELDGQCKQM